MICMASNKKKVENQFKEVISDFLRLHSLENESFKNHLKKESKNIDDCIKYIYGAVKESGRNGFTDKEIYNLAIHYYVEDDVKVGSATPSHMIINQEIKFSKAEKEQIKAEARERLIKEEMDKITKKGKKSNTAVNKKDNLQLLF
jgi:hypothetical protein